MFSNSLDHPCIFSIRAYTTIRLPFKLPESTKKYNLSTSKSKHQQRNRIPNKYAAQLLLNAYFSHYIHAFYPCLLCYWFAFWTSTLSTKKTAFSSQIRLIPLRNLSNKCTAQLQDQEQSKKSIKLDKCNKRKEGDRKRKLPKSWQKRSRVK